MLMAPIYVSKMIEIHYQEKHLVTSLIFILIFSKKKKKVYSDFKYQAHKFSNKFDVGIFYVFKVGIIKITLKPFFVRRDFFPFKLMISNILQFFRCLHFCLNLHNVFPFFLNKNCQIL